MLVLSSRGFQALSCNSLLSFVFIVDQSSSFRLVGIHLLSLALIHTTFLPSVVYIFLPFLISFSVRFVVLY